MTDRQLLALFAGALALSAHSLNRSAQYVLIILQSDDDLANIAVLTNWNFSQMSDFTTGACLRAPLHPS
jgi:hypothetical protein